MNKRAFRFLGWLAAIILILGLGAVAGGGAVYALTQNQAGDAPVEAAQANTEPGILISSVIPDSPAAQAGLKRGDVLLKIDDQAVNRPYELISHLQTLPVGSQAQLTAQRGDEERLLTATLGERNGQPYLGIVPCGSLQGAVAFTEAKRGAMISEVRPDSPAAQAGLQPGDLVTAVEGQAVDRENSLADLISAYAPGDTVILTIERPGEEAREVTVQLGEQPEQAGVAYLGVRFRQLPHFAMMFRGLPAHPGQPPFIEPHLGEDFFVLPDGIEQGVIIRAVAEDSPAAAAGLTAGDIITAIEGEPLEGRPSALREAIAARQPGETVTLTVVRAGEEESREVAVVLAENPDEAGSAYLGVSVGGFFQFHHAEPGLDIQKRIELFSEPEGFFEELPPKFERFEAPLFDEFEFGRCDDPSNCFDGSI